MGGGFCQGHLSGVEICTVGARFRRFALDFSGWDMEGHADVLGTSHTPSIAVS